MKITPFRMERWQSMWENRVELNLSESGVHPMTPRELMELAGRDPGELLDERLVYNQSNGTDELRAHIAALYPGAGPENVLVTNGGSEANYVTVWSLVERDDTVVMQVPNYMQMWGLADAFGARMRPFRLLEAEAWRPDLDELRDRLDPSVKAIIVTNPNNPTGAILSEAEMEEIVRCAGDAGSWIVADEIYIGAELRDELTPSFWGRHDRLIVTGGLSKAYGLPGLRIGWVVGPAELIERLWSHKDYTSIAPGTLADICARAALLPATRERIRERTRTILNENLPLLTEWFAGQRETFEFVPPRAGAICYTRYRLDIGSSALAQRLKDQESVLVVPGDHFNMDGYLRLGYGPTRRELTEALGRIERLISSLRL